MCSGLDTVNDCNLGVKVAMSMHGCLTEGGNSILRLFT